MKKTIKYVLSSIIMSMLALKCFMAVGMAAVPPPNLRQSQATTVYKAATVTASPLVGDTNFVVTDATTGVFKYHNGFSTYSGNDYLYVYTGGLGLQMVCKAPTGAIKAYALKNSYGWTGSHNGKTYYCQEAYEGNTRKSPSDIVADLGTYPGVYTFYLQYDNSGSWVTFATDTATIAYPVPYNISGQSIGYVPPSGNESYPHAGYPYGRIYVKTDSSHTIKVSPTFLNKEMKLCWQNPGGTIKEYLLSTRQYSQDLTVEGNGTDPCKDLGYEYGTWYAWIKYKDYNGAWRDSPTKIACFNEPPWMDIIRTSTGAYVTIGYRSSSYTTSGQYSGSTDYWGERHWKTCAGIKVWAVNRGESTAKVYTNYTVVDCDSINGVILQSPRFTIPISDHGGDRGKYIMEELSGAKRIYAFEMSLPTAKYSPYCPSISYTGASTYSDSIDANGNVIRTLYLLSSGTLTVGSNASASATIVGGGGKGGFGYYGKGTCTQIYHGAGGGGGLITRQILNLEAKSYNVTIGNGGTWTGWTGTDEGLGYEGEPGHASIINGWFSCGGREAYYRGIGGYGNPRGNNVTRVGGSDSYGGYGSINDIPGIGGEPGIYSTRGDGGSGVTYTKPPYVYDHGRRRQLEGYHSGTSGQPGVIALSFQIKSYTVRYNGNGATSGSMADTKIAVGASAPLRANTFAKEGTLTLVNNNGAANTTMRTNLNFIGWAKTATGAKVYNNGQTVSNLSTTDKAVVNLYAVWGAANAVTLPTPTRANYNFKGWYKDAALTQFAGNGGAAYAAPNAVTTLYAKWEIMKRTITVTSSPHGTVSPSPMTVDHGSPATFTITCDTGYLVDYIVIDGVRRDDLGAGPTYTVPSVTKDTTMQVVYKLKEYTLTVTYDEGVDVSPHTKIVKHFDRVVFNIAPIFGYEIVDVIYNGVSQGILTTYTTPPISGPSTMYIKAQPLYDFEIISIVPGEIRVGVPMFFAVKFANDGIAHPSVPMDLTINGMVLHSSTRAVERGEAYCYFDWTPTFAGTYDVSVVVNPGNVIEEKDYTNNAYSTTVVVKPAIDETDGRDPYNPEDDPTLSYVPLPTGDNANELTWTENGVTYWARMNFNARFTAPDVDPLASGYGLSAQGTVTITHNYYDDSRVRQPRGVIMYLPEFEYKKGVELELMPDGTWQLPVNPSSPIGARRWYIPTQFADGRDYAVLFQCYGAYTPGGELTSAKSDKKTIEGSMYEDDYTIGS